MLGFLLSLSLLAVGSYGLRSFVDPVVFANSHVNIPPPPQYSWTEYWYQNMPIDHFAYADSRTFALRYLMNLDNYKLGGAIFFYAGNEGSVEDFAKNTGLMWDVSQQFNAAVVFAEHRFYGKSQPFGDQSYAKLSNLGYLSSEQALADYAILIGYLKKGVGNGTIPSATNAPVIAFGGSYGGMLAAWFRIKYPHVVIGALASSAPVLLFEGTDVDQGALMMIVKRTYVNSGCNADNFPNAWKAIKNLANSTDGRNFLNNLFKLAPASQLTKIEQAEGLLYFIREGIEYMSEVDYPYPTNFFKPLPGWPIQVACQWLNGTINDDKALATAMYNVANLYYNYTGSETSYCAPLINASCPDAAASVLTPPLGWPWQLCTEMVLPICAKGPPNDLFWNDCGTGWTPDVIYRGCSPIFGNLGYTRAMLRPDWIITNYGGNFAAASNIIFSNGALDPVSGGGVTPKSPGVAQANGIYALLIDQSGHHLDLRQPNSCDPPSVKQARYLEVNIMWCWAFPNDAMCQSTATSTASTSSSSTTTAPSTTSTSTTTTPTTTTTTSTTTSTSASTTTSASCNYVKNGYPWGQTGSSTPPPPSTTTASKGSLGLTPLLGLVLSAFFVFIIRV